MKISITNQVRAYMESNPKATAKGIAEALGLTRQQVYTARWIVGKKKRKAAVKKRAETIAAKTGKAAFVPQVRYGEIVGVRSPDPEPLVKVEPAGWPAVWEAIKRAMRGEK
jgi:hypothetical protein